MSLRVLATSWITPCGRGDDLTVPPHRGIRVNPFSGREYPCLEPHAEDYADATRLPRLRRSSTISHLAVSAALAAAGEGDFRPGSLVFATADGGIIYTRKFWDSIAEANAGAGSPLLFPETVHNAPASHIAAILGITGTVLTVSGDEKAGLQALRAAEQLLRAGISETCLVVAAQEVDWITGEARAALGKTRAATGGAALPAAGAAALVLSLDDGTPLPGEPAEVAGLGDCRGVSPLWGLIRGLRLTSPEGRR